MNTSVCETTYSDESELSICESDFYTSTDTGFR